MAERIATGEVRIDLNDAAVVAGLRAVDSEFDRTMNKIDRARATAQADLNLAKLDDAVANAKRKLRALEKERAVAVLRGDDHDLDEKITKARLKLKAIDGKRATVELRVKGDKAVADALDRQNKLLADQEKAAIRAAKANEARSKQATVGLDRETSRAIELQRQYARLTDKLETLNKKRPIGREARAKVELDAAGVIAKMEALKTELNWLGGHPPVEIKADIDRKGLNRILHGFGGFLATLGNKAAGLSDLSIRLGPFTTSLRGLGLALAFLGPTITDLIGATGSLIGVLGAGISGAAALGSAGLVGMLGNFLGLKFAMRNTGQELAQARTSISAYQNAILKYGREADKTKTKQQEMNNVLRQISPLAREAALGTERFFRGWDRSTKPTQNNLGVIARDGFAALNKLRPMWARRTNEMSGMLQKGLSASFKWLSTGPGRDLIGGIFKDFNAQIPTLLHGLGQFGEAFLRFAREGARNFDVLAHGFDNLGTRLNNFTKNDDFGSTVKRWVQYAKDVANFFGAATRVMVHFFGDGSKAGDNFTRSMTNTLNRWDDFLTSTQGKNRMGDFFQNSVDGARQLYRALKPIISLFALWATGLEPAVTAITKIATWVTEAVNGFGHLLGMGNALATFGATLGTVFAVSKIGGFVSMLARAATLMRELGAIGTLKGIFSGSFVGSLRAGGGIAAAGTEAAAAMRAAIVSGGGIAAAEIRTAMEVGGGIAAAEEGGAEVVGGAGAARLLGSAGAGAVGGEAVATGAAAATAEGGLAAFGITAGSVATGGLALLGAGLVAAVIAFGDTQDAGEKLNKKLKDLETQQGIYRTRLNDTTTSTNAHERAITHLNKAMEDARKRLKETKDGTVAHRQAEIDLYNATQKRNAQVRARTEQAKEHVAAAKAEIHSLDETRTATKDLNKEEIANQKTKLAKIEAMNREAGLQEHAGQGWAAEKAKLDALERERANALIDVNNKLAAAKIRAAAAGLNEARAQKNLPAVTGRAARNLGALAQKAPGMAQKIALKYESPRDVGQIAAQARRALAAGVGKGVVLKIVADSKNATQALKALNRIELKEKLQKLGITGHKGVLSALDAVDRKAIKEKLAKLRAEGVQVTAADIDRIIRKQIPDKHFSINTAAGAALLQLQLVAAGLSRIQSKTITVSVRRLGGLPHASGLKRGGEQHDALIGEGNAPEWHVNTRRGFAYKTPGPMFVRLGPEDAIIPTEPAHKGAGRNIMRDIARELGLKMYKKAKKPDPKKIFGSPQSGKAKAPAPPKTASSMSAPAAHRHLAKPADYRAAAVPLDAAQSNLDAAQKLVDDDNTNKDKYNGQIDSANQTLKYAKAGSTSEKRAKDKKAAALKALGKIKSHHADHVTARNEAKKRLADLKAANSEIDHYNQLIANDKTLMDNASTRFEKSQDPSEITKWTAAQTDRASAIASLKKVLARALKLARKVKGPGQKDYIDQLVGDLATLDSTQLDNNQPPPAATDHDLQWLLTKGGLWDAYQKNIADIAVAKTNNVADDPGTAKREDIESLADDKTATAALVKLFDDNKVLDWAKATGESSLITETANAITSAREDAQSIASQINDAAAATGPSQVDLFDTARASLYKDYGGNANPNVGGLGGDPSRTGGGVTTNPALLTTPSDAGAVAVGSSAAAGSLLGARASGVTGTAGAAAAPAQTNVTVNNKFSAPPPDPHTWSAGVGFELGAMV